jgi:hypothetical protein
MRFQCRQAAQTHHPREMVCCAVGRSASALAFAFATLAFATLLPELTHAMHHLIVAMSPPLNNGGVEEGGEESFVIILRKVSWPSQSS